MPEKNESDALLVRPLAGRGERGPAVAADRPEPAAEAADGAEPVAEAADKEGER